MLQLQQHFDVLGQATQILRKLITCRKLGMTITPSNPKVFNYSLFEGHSPPMQGNSGLTDKEKTSARRKQSYPTKANVAEEVNSSLTQLKFMLAHFFGDCRWMQLMIAIGLDKCIRRRIIAIMCQILLEVLLGSP